jgi:hypothetical protein
MKKLFAVLTATLMAAGPASAVATVFPVLEAGTYHLRAQAAPVETDLHGDPMAPPTKSISLFNEADGIRVGCEPVDAEGIASFSVTLMNDGRRNVLRGKAHELDGCGGLESDPSDNRAIIFFNRPGKAILKDKVEVVPAE